MVVILIRHARREDNSTVKDEDQALSAVGRQQALALAAVFDKRSLRPEVYFTSKHAHASETAAILAARTAVGANVTEMETLTPRRSPLPPSWNGTFTHMVDETKTAGYDLSKLNVIAFVLHFPRINQLLAVLTATGTSLNEPGFAEAIYVRADTFDALCAGKGEEFDRTHGHARE